MHFWGSHSMRRHTRSIREEIWEPYPTSWALTSLSRYSQVTLANSWELPTTFQVHSSQYYLFSIWSHARNLPIHSKLRSITHVATNVHVILRSFAMSTWMSDTIELVLHVTLWNLNSFSSHFCWCGPLHLGRCGICMHKHSTSGRRRRRRHSTFWHITHCEGVDWLLWWFFIDQIYDTWERNVTTRSEICTTRFSRVLGC